MVPAKETAEEQLLRMIEGSKGSAPSKVAWHPASLGRFMAPFWKGGGFLRRWSGRTLSQRDQGDAFLWQLQLTGRVFWVILAGLGLYLVVDLWVLQPTLPPTLLSQVTPPPGPATSGTLPPTLEEQLRQSAEYRSTLAARNPFRLATGRMSETTAGQSVKNKLVELTNTLTIVGINRGKIPEALIEDTEAKHTYFVKVGDQINGMTVSAIDENGVKITYEGEELVLK